LKWEKGKGEKTETKKTN